MRIKKLGFTLAEVLISMAVIGVIMAMSMQTIKIVKSSYTSLTYFEYKNIQQIAGEMIAGERPFNEYDDNYTKLDTSTETLIQSNGARVQIINTDDLAFCNLLIEMSNTSGAKNCQSLFTPAMKAEPYIKDLDIDAPTFMTTAGKKYYLTKRVKNNAVSKEYGYRLLAVDLNGKQAPNISEKKGRKIPDIVTFMIMDTGEIFPLGVAADNLPRGDGKRILYINSKLKGYYFSDRQHNGGVPEECTLKGGKSGSQKVCNYAVIYIPNTTRDSNNKLSLYSYREAYCSSLGNRKSNYETYCNGLAVQPLCPPSDADKQFDMCRFENVKPVFRYNF